MNFSGMTSEIIGDLTIGIS